LLPSSLLLCCPFYCTYLMAFQGDFAISLADCRASRFSKSVCRKWPSLSFRMVCHVSIMPRLSSFRVVWSTFGYSRWIIRAPFWSLSPQIPQCRLLTLITWLSSIFKLLWGLVFNKDNISTSLLPL
jgi:hypothetical protein